MPRAVTLELRLRGVDVLTAQEDGSAGFDDVALLRRATELKRVLVSQDSDLLKVGAQFLAQQEHFSGIVYAHQLRVTMGQMVANLEIIAKATVLQDWRGKIEYLPFS